MFMFDEKEVSITDFRRRPRSVYRFIDIPGHIVVLTRRGKRELVMMAIETYAYMTGDYDRTMSEIESLIKEHREKGVP